MSIEVVIRNKRLLKKPLELKDLTLGKYAYASFDAYKRNTSEIENGDLVIYDPKKIGRGIGVMGWTPNTKDEIHMVLNTLSTKYDFEMFYDIIRNVMQLWKTTTFEQDGITFSASDINQLCQDQRKGSLDIMASLDEMIKPNDNGYSTIFGAMFPLDISMEDFKRFGSEKDEEGYAQYLHDLQSVDAYYAVPLFYKSKKEENSFFGNYAITSETDTIFPTKPIVLPFFKNPTTGGKLECSFFVVSLYSLKQKKVIARMTFEDFVRLADVKDCPAFDMTHVMLKGLSEEKMAEMAASDYTDPLA